MFHPRYMVRFLTVPQPPIPWANATEELPDEIPAMPFPHVYTSIEGIRGDIGLGKAQAPQPIHPRATWTSSEASGSRTRRRSAAFPDASCSRRPASLAFEDDSSRNYTFNWIIGIELQSPQTGHAGLAPGPLLRESNSFVKEIETHSRSSNSGRSPPAGSPCTLQHYLVERFPVNAKREGVAKILFLSWTRKG